jgi:DNA-binding NtrC family response regulator
VLLDFQERLARWLADAQARQRALKLDGDLVRAFQLQGIIGRSPAILDLFSKIRRIAPEQVDVRIVAATNRDLRTLVSECKIREDLYFRLSTIEVKLPRLAERREDLPMLQRHFLDLYSLRYGKPRMHLTRRAKAALSKYSWPGNVRELENVIASCCMIAEGETIDLGDLPEPVVRNDSQEVAGQGVLLSLAQVELNHAQQVLTRVQGNRAQAAKILGISRATLYRLIAKNRSVKHLSGKNYVTDPYLGVKGSMLVGWP